MLHAIVFLPLLGAIIAGFFGRQIGDRGSQIVTCACMLVSAVLGWITFQDVALAGNVRTVEVLTWINSGNFMSNHPGHDTLRSQISFIF